MAHKKNAQFTGGTDSSDRKAEVLSARRGRGELSAEDFFQALEALRYSSIMGAYASSLYAVAYLETRGEDTCLLWFLAEARKRYPGNRMLQAPLAVAYLDFGLYALALDAIEGIQALRKADRGALLDIERMEDEARQSLLSRRLSWEKDRMALVALDEARWKLLAGHEEEASRKVASVLLERPLWIPALEDRALLAWDACRFDEAEEALKALLGIDANSVEALSGIVRLLILLDRAEEAAPYASRLLAPAVFDLGSVQCLEAAILARSACGGVESIRPPISDPEERKLENPYLRHLVAILSLSIKDEKDARKLWSDADDPRIEELQEENLEDLDRAPAERRGPFAIRFIDLLPLSCKMATLSGPIGDNIEREHAIDDLIGMVRTKAGALVKGLTKVLFALGDLTSIEILVDRLLAPWFPELDSFVLAEANSPSLSKRRRELIQTFLERTAIGSDSKPKKDAALAIRQWDISWEARAIPAPLRAENERAFGLSSSGDFSGAARMYASLADRAPREPSFKHNLRYALYSSGRKEEADRLGAEMSRDFPAYLPVQIEIALEAADSGDTRRATRILDGLCARRAFHGDELRSIVKARIDLLVREKNIQAAADWYGLWKEFEVDEDKLKDYSSLELLLSLQKRNKKYRERKARQEPTSKKNREAEPRNDGRGNATPDDGQLSLFDS